jgi:dolichyl-phosphate-mannose--protein O-mannosyl transferase
VKWSGVVPLLVAIALVAANRRSHRAIALSLDVVPFLVYVAAYLAFWIAHGPDVLAFVHLQVHMLTTQLGTTGPNPLASSPASWPLLLDPLVAYPTATGRIPPGATRIVAVGNPVLWWALLLAVPAQLWAALRRRETAARIAVLGYLSVWAPWLLFGRTEYLYYMTPAVPFMAVGLVAAIRALGPLNSRVGIAVGALAGAAAIALAPVWLGLPASERWYDAIRLLPGRW